MWARVSGPENKGDVGLQPCHGLEGRESKDKRTITAVSTSCSSTRPPIFLLLSTGQAEVASVASNSVREFQVKVREVPEGARESLGGDCSGVFGCRNDLPLEAWRLESDKEENSNHRHH